MVDLKFLFIAPISYGIGRLHYYVKCAKISGSCSKVRAK